MHIEAIDPGTKQVLGQPSSDAVGVAFLVLRARTQCFTTARRTASYGGHVLRISFALNEQLRPHSPPLDSAAVYLSKIRMTWDAMEQAISWLNKDVKR